MVCILLVVACVFGLGFTRHQSFAMALISLLTVALAPSVYVAWTLESDETGQGHS
ncbi:MAG: hypothetical protein AB8G18_05295 [Gammaproteobacteria bacterium]